VRLRAYGSYAIRVADARRLLEELVSTDGLYQTDEISDHIRNMIVSSLTYDTQTSSHYQGERGEHY
jgi:membrane protease subunit (stomatin/prohibitin family)